MFSSSFNITTLTPVQEGDWKLTEVLKAKVLVEDDGTIIVSNKITTQEDRVAIGQGIKFYFTGFEETVNDISTDEPFIEIILHREPVKK